MSDGLAWFRSRPKRLGWFVLAALIGFMLGNWHRTEQALQGQRVYYKQVFCPTLAKKAVIAHQKEVGEIP